MFLRDFIGITPADEEALGEVAAILSEKVGLGPLVAMIYERLLSYPETAHFFRAQDMEVRKRALASYLARLLQGRFDPQFDDGHTEVGRVHQRADIPLEFLVATYGWVRSLLPELLLEALPDEPQRAVALLTAVNRALDYDLCLLTQGYVRNGTSLAVL